MSNHPVSDRIAVTSRSFSRHPQLRTELLAQFSNVKFNDDGLSLKGTELIEFLRGCNRAILALEKVDSSMLGQLPELHTISKVGVGLDNFDLQAMRDHGVALAWQPGTNSRSVAELVVVLALNLMRGIVPQNLELKSGKWRQQKGRCLSGSTVGIVGCGYIGKELVQLLRGFGCRILVCDEAADRKFLTAHELEQVSLELLLVESDLVTLHLPLNSITHHIINSSRLQTMKPGGYLINTARGGLVDEVALQQALETGHLAGAACDVFETEPPAPSKLLELPNFIATPHIGGSTEEAILAMGRAAIRGLDCAKIPST